MPHNQTLSWYSRSPHTHSLTLHRAQGPTAAARPPQLNSCSKISSLKPPRQIFLFLPAVTAPTRCDAPGRHESTWIRAYICQHHILAIWTPIFTIYSIKCHRFQKSAVFQFLHYHVPSCAHLQFRPQPHVAHGNHEYVIKSTQINR